jgi:hypothetical protein
LKILAFLGFGTLVTNDDTFFYVVFWVMLESDGFPLSSSSSYFSILSSICMKSLFFFFIELSGSWSSSFAELILFSKKSSVCFKVCNGFFFFNPQSNPFE